MTDALRLNYKETYRNTDRHYCLKIIIKYSRLSHDVVTCDVDRNVLTAYC